jgi:hypothetical protein
MRLRDTLNYKGSERRMNSSSSSIIRSRPTICHKRSRQVHRPCRQQQAERSLACNPRTNGLVRLRLCIFLEF